MNPVSLQSTPDAIPALLEEIQRMEYARSLGYVQDGPWWIHPDGTRTSLDGLPQFPSAAAQRLSLIAATPLSLEHAATRYAVTWDACPWCEL